MKMIESMILCEVMLKHVETVCGLFCEEVSELFLHDILIVIIMNFMMELSCLMVGVETKVVCELL